MLTDKQKEAEREKMSVAFDADKCRLFEDKCYGIGQAVWTFVTNLTGLMLAGKNVVVAGYGAKGKDIAGTARAFGARVTVAESNVVKALEAVMDGFDVSAMDEAARYGDIFVTATDAAKVISEQAFMVMKDGAVLCNVGADCAIDTVYLEETYIEKEIRENGVTEYELMNGRCLKVINDGRNLASEADELDKAVYELVAKKLAEMFPDGVWHGAGNERNDSVEANYLEQIINEAREEVARHMLRTLGVRI
ncbi:MAG: hypothetical protein E7261_07025 [Lachnospiraceae bacterium]|nr:hypothetical protein [Lachnospiraceae bacterium]